MESERIMRDGKIAIEIDLKRIGWAALMALCIMLAIKCGEGETLLFIVPAGLYAIFGKETA